MATPVFTWAPANGGLKRVRKIDMVMLDLGDGYYRTGIKSVAWTHQDGTGGADTSYRGTTVWDVTLPVMANATFYAVLDFLQARIDAGFESFYFYDVRVEPDTTQWDGITTAGRHLVKYFGEIGDAMRSYGLSNMARLKFHETQT